MQISFARYAFAWLAVILALGSTGIALAFTDHPWFLPPLGGSCVILFGMPDSDMAQPRSFLGGHLIATLTGLVFLHFGQQFFGGSETAWMIAAVATALVLMMATRTIHSPAGANPIVVFYEHAGWSFLLAPVAIGLMLLLLTALLFNNRLLARRYPQSWI